jgi:Ca2+/Na+ antiporter
MTVRMVGRADVTTVIGVTAVVFSAVYLVSDVIELAQGGFSTFQLVLTYLAEAAIPLFVLGLYAMQRPQVGRLGLVAAVGYAYTFVYFTSTVVLALVERTADWTALQNRLGAWLTVHSVLMVVAGVAFGVAVIRAKVFPQWTGIALILGMVLMTATTALPDALRTMSAGVRDVAFAGMGASLLRVATRPTPDVAPLQPTPVDHGHIAERSGTTTFPSSDSESASSGRRAGA